MTKIWLRHQKNMTKLYPTTHVNLKMTQSDSKALYVARIKSTMRSAYMVAMSGDLNPQRVRSIEKGDSLVPMTVRILLTDCRLQLNSHYFLFPPNTLVKLNPNRTAFAPSKKFDSVRPRNCGSIKPVELVRKIWNTCPPVSMSNPMDTGL